PPTSVFARIPLPALSFKVNVTTGFCPAPPTTFRIWKLIPGAVADIVGTVWAPMIEASNSSSPLAMWHCEHWLSSTCGRLTWFWPVEKLTSLWQPPQAARLGAVIQALVCAAPFLGLWQVSQTRGSNSEVEGYF